MAIFRRSKRRLIPQITPALKSFRKITSSLASVVDFNIDPAIGSLTNQSNSSSCTDLNVFGDSHGVTGDTEGGRYGVKETSGCTTKFMYRALSVFI